MSKKVLISAFILVAVLVGIVILGSSKSTPTNTPTQNVQGKKYTLSDVSKHKDASNCWSAINGKVYDLTSFINEHPGGPARILSICGTDGSSAFNDQHGSSRRPNSELESFYIGDLSS